MRWPLFRRIEEAVTQSNRCFTRRANAIGELGLSSTQKVTAALRMLAYNTSADSLDEHLRLGETTAIDCLHIFTHTVCQIFGPEYLREPTEEDQVRIMTHSVERGFTGMMGSVDCIHWDWKSCPTLWHGQFQDRTSSKSVILEAVAMWDLWICHAHFGTPGSANDINVLDRSHLFHSILRGTAQRVSFQIGHRDFDQSYYLGDQIYPDWAVFLKTIANPLIEKQSYFAMRQESTRKDIERAFGVLKLCWAVLRNPMWLWHRVHLYDIIMCCIILHNMAVENEMGDALDCLNWTGPDVIVSPIAT